MVTWSQRGLNVELLAGTLSGRTWNATCLRWKRPWPRPSCLLEPTRYVQCNKAIFHQYEVNPTCPLCSSGEEDRTHLLLHCEAMKDIRSKHMRIIASIVPDFDTLLDWQKINLILGGNFGKTPNYPVVRDTFNLEAATKTYIFNLHCTRIKLINGSWIKRRFDSTTTTTTTTTIAPIFNKQRLLWTIYYMYVSLSRVRELFYFTQKSWYCSRMSQCRDFYQISKISRIYIGPTYIYSMKQHTTRHWKATRSKHCACYLVMVWMWNYNTNPSFWWSRIVGSKDIWSGKNCRKSGEKVGVFLFPDPVGTLLLPLQCACGMLPGHRRLLPGPFLLGLLRVWCCLWCTFS